MKEFLANLHPDSTPCRVVCPACGGGSTKERSLHISFENNTWKWICFRASCSNRGRLRKGRYLIEQEAPEEPPQPSLRPPPRGYTAYPIKDALGEPQGFIYRRADDMPAHYSKTINRFAEGWVGMHFPSILTSDTVIVVEDWKSSEAMDKYFPCVSILGTNLSVEKLNYLYKNGVRRVILALDNDATRQSVIIKRRTLMDVQVLPLQHDFKDDTEENLKLIAESLL